MWRTAHPQNRMKIGGINQTYEGLILRLQRSILSKDKEAMQPHIRAFVERAVTFTTCPDCGGERAAALAELNARFAAEAVILGTAMEELSMVLLTMPVFFPVIVQAMGATKLNRPPGFARVVIDGRGGHRCDWPR